MKLFSFKYGVLQNSFLNYSFILVTDAIYETFATYSPLQFSHPSLIIQNRHMQVKDLLLIQQLDMILDLFSGHQLLFIYLLIAPNILLIFGFHHIQIFKKLSLPFYRLQSCSCVLYEIAIWLYGRIAQIVSLMPQMKFFLFLQ